MSSSLLALLLASPANAMMVQVPGQGVIVPQWIITTTSLEDGSGIVGTLNSATTKIAVNGRVFQKDLNFRQGAVTKSISKISFATSAGTCAACTDVVQVDVETPSTSAGPPSQPDGVILASGGAVATKALSGLIANTWVSNMTAFTTPPVVTYGQSISLVFSLSTFSTGTFNLKANTGAQVTQSNFGPFFSITSNGSTWTVGNPQLAQVNIQLDFTDGTTGAFIGAFPYSATGQQDAYNSGSGFSEVGLSFQLPWNVQVDQICAANGISTTSSTGRLELTDDNALPNVMASIDFDPHTLCCTGIAALGCYPVNVQTIKKNTWYHVGWRATSANNVNMQSLSLGIPGTMDTFMGASAKFGYATRLNGAWSSINTGFLPYVGFVVSAFDDGMGAPKGSVYNGLSQ